MTKQERREFFRKNYLSIVTSSLSIICAISMILLKDYTFAIICLWFGTTTSIFLIDMYILYRHTKNIDKQMADYIKEYKEIHKETKRIQKTLDEIKKVS